MTEKMTNVAIGEVVAKAMQDDSLKQALMSDADKVLADDGISVPGIHFEAVEDTGSVKNVIMPFEPLAPEHRLDTLEPEPTPKDITRYIITKAQEDAGFRDKVVSDIDGVLQDIGVRLPPGISLNVLANTADKNYLVIPYAPPASGELSDAQLAAVAGGKSNVAANTNVAANAEALINAVAVTEGAAVADVAAAAQAAAAAEVGVVAVAVVVLT